MTTLQNEDITTEQLDHIAATLFQDQLPMKDVHKAWCDELAKRLIKVADMFDDGEDVIILAKLADQLPRMFEKMRDNVQSQVRPKVISNAGFSFNGGKYTQLKDLPRVQRMQKRRKVSLDMYKNDPDYAMSLMSGSGYVELPDDAK